MKRTTIFGLLLVITASLALAAAFAPLRRLVVTAQQNPVTRNESRKAQPQARRTPQPQDNFDIRANINRSLPTPPETANATQEFSQLDRANKQRSTAQLLAEHPQATVNWSSLTGTPSRIVNWQEPGAEATNEESSLVGRRFLTNNRAIFRLSENEVNELRVTRQDKTNHNGVTHLTYEQQIDGLDIFQGTMSVHLDRSGAVIAANGELMPQAKNFINRSRPTITATDALQLAAVAADLPALEISQPMIETGTPQQISRFANIAGLQRTVEAKLLYFPLAHTSIRLAWALELWLQDTPDVYLVIIDAERGTLLYRHNYTNYENPHGLVYTQDGPRPDMPHVNDNPPYVPAEDVPFRATPFNGATTFAIGNPHYDWWAGASQTSLISNNTDAHLDRSPTDNIADEPRLTVADSNFSFTANFDTPPTDAENQKAAQVNLFYWVNRYHDILYSYGFTESSGNFQTNNFGLGGQGDDAIQADAQDGSGVNNANFSTPADGRAGRVQMYLWNSGTPQQLDGDFDQGVIVHELTHGLSNRLIGNGAGLSGLQSGGMGEGWSDYFGTVLLRKESDNVDGVYAVGQYVRNNYPAGIRRYPYSTDKTVNPLTYKIITGETSVHRIGEVWCTTLLEMRALLIKKYGFTEGQRQSIQLVVDGLKLTPNAPSFIDARDAILLADRVNNNGANQCLMWQAFAKRGLGINANSLGASDSAPTESFDAPAACSDSGTLTLDKKNYLPGETMRITLGDRNASAPAQITLTSSITGDQETITVMPENGLPGSFKAQIKIAAGKANNGDGLLQASVDNNDQINVAYQDQSNATGTTAEVKVTATITREKIIFADNVESGNQGWIVNGNWSIVTTKSASPTHSWTDTPVGNYTVNSNTSITSPVFDCANLSEVTLQFAHSYDLETNFDFGLVEYSIDNGTTWLRVAAFSGSSSFTQAVVPLNALANQSRARLRFRLVSDNVVNLDGWFIDDIRITGRSANAAIVKPGDQQAPVITALSPAFGAPGGGTKVTISGANFSETSDTSVTFDGIAATAINVISSSTMTATTPAHAIGAVNVRVKNRYGEAALSNGFTYYQTGSATAAPLLTQIFPASGATRGGTVVTISGANFTPETTVKFGANSAVVTFVNANSLRVLSPSSSFTGAVEVIIANGAQTANLPNGFTYTTLTPPTIQTITPEAGQTLYAGSLAAITWNSSDNRALTKHRISLYRDSTLVGEIATDATGEAQSFYWRIPATQTLANNYRVRVIATDDEGAESESYSATFSIGRNWQLVTSMPAFLMRTTLVSDGNGIFAIGGRTTTASSTAIDSVRRYDANNNFWSPLASLPMALSSTDAALINGKIYVPGGATETSVVETHYVYDIAANTWSTSMNTGLAASAYACATDAPNNIFYITGGLNNATAPITNARSFNVQTNTWTTLPTMLTARYAHKAALIDDKLYVAGGLGAAGGLTSGEVFDFASQRWTNIAPLNRPRAFAASGIYRDGQGNPYWVLAGGHDVVANVSLATTEVYDVRNNRWLALDASFNASVARTFTNGAIAGEYFYMIGGGTGTLTQPSASNLTERIKLPLNLNSLGTPPSLAAPAQLLATAGNELKFSVTANALNAAATLSITATNLPAGASFVMDAATNNDARGTLRWTPSSGDTGKSFVVTFKVTDGFLSDTKNVIVNVVATSPMGVVNAAHYLPGALSAESIVAAFGDNLALRIEAPSTLPLPTELAGAKVTVNGIPAPLLYVSPSQINFVMPANLDPGTATIIISSPNGKYSLASMQVANQAPSLFTISADGRGDAAALATSDGINYLPAPFDITVNNKPNFLILFGTGFRNAAATNPKDENGVAESVRVTIDGIEARVDYAGAQGFFAGLDQLNVVIPATLPPGARRVEVVVTLNGVEANRVTIPLK